MASDNYQIDNAEKILNQYHYGLKQVKQNILQLIAVANLKKTINGRILCLIGPPGTGKTTLAKSIAQALNRKYYRISLGGVSMSSTLKGHRRTYVASYPGEIIKALKNTGTSNCVILLDEIDKMDKNSFHGNPISQLLQILDLNQNFSFVDNYLDYPVDLSRVFFICSANYIDNLPNIIHLYSYTYQQKYNILTEYIIKRIMEQNYLKQDEFKLDDNIPEILIKKYSKNEPGVRQLERQVKKLFQKIIYQIIQKQQNNQPKQVIHITADNLSKYMGLPIFQNKQLINEIGTAYFINSYYYIVNKIEIILTRTCTSDQKNSENKVNFYTGTLGKILKQTINISFTFAKIFLYKKFNNTYYNNNWVHINIPQRGVSNHGANSGLAIITAMVSLALNKKMNRVVGLLGQVTLKGKVLGCENLKELVIIAKRYEFKQVILSDNNRCKNILQAQIQNTQEQVKKGLKFTFVENFEDVYNQLFGQLK